MLVISEAVTGRTVTLGKSNLFPLPSFFKICPRDLVDLVLKYKFKKTNSALRELVLIYINLNEITFRPRVQALVCM